MCPANGISWYLLSSYYVVNTYVRTYVRTCVFMCACMYCRRSWRQGVYKIEARSAYDKPSNGILTGSYLGTYLLRSRLLPICAYMWVIRDGRDYLPGSKVLRSNPKLPIILGQSRAYLMSRTFGHVKVRVRLSHKPFPLLPLTASYASPVLLCLPTSYILHPGLSMLLFYYIGNISTWLYAHADNI